MDDLKKKQKPSSLRIRDGVEERFSGYKKQIMQQKYKTTDIDPKHERHQRERKKETVNV